MAHIHDQLEAPVLYPDEHPLRLAARAALTEALLHPERPKGPGSLWRIIQRVAADFGELLLEELPMARRDAVRANQRLDRRS